MKEKKFINRGIVVFLGAMICCGLWGSAYGMVKLGMNELGLQANDTAAVTMFAGERFTLAGIFVVIIGSILQKKLLIPNKKQLPKIGVLAIFQTIGQYIPYYIGLAHTTGVNTAIVDSLAYFLSILTAAIIFRLEPMTAKKTIGCLLGFISVILINMNGLSLDFNMTFMGEGLILLSAISYGFSSVFAKVFSQGDNPVLLSGYQFIFGGCVIMFLAHLGGAEFMVFHGKTLAIFIYLALVSTIAYTLWTILLKYNDVSKVSIYGFTNPIYGVIFAAIILKEYQGFSLKYLLALALVSVGIALVNVVQKKDSGSSEE